MPAELTTALVEAATAALTADTPVSRWATVIDALSYSPVHLKVIPPSVPAEPGEALLTAIKNASTRVPQIAALFGIEPTAAAPARRRGRGGPKAKPGTGSDNKKSSAKPVPPPPPVPTAAAEPAAEAATEPAVESVSEQPQAPDAQPSSSDTSEG